MSTTTSSADVTRYVAHLTPELLEIAQRALVAKAIGEFSHERLLAPEAGGDGYSLITPDGTATYRFRANVHALNHWVLDLPSIERIAEGQATPLDAGFHRGVRAGSRHPAEPAADLPRGDRQHPGVLDLEARELHGKR